MVTRYLYDHGQRYYPKPLVQRRHSERAVDTRQPIVIHTKALERVMAEIGSTTTPGQRRRRPSFVFAFRILSGDVATGDHRRGQLRAQSTRSRDSDVSLHHVRSPRA